VLYSDKLVIMFDYYLVGGLVGGLHWYVHKLSDQEKMNDSKDAVKNLFGIKSI